MAPPTFHTFQGGGGGEWKVKPLSDIKCYELKYFVTHNLMEPNSTSAKDDSISNILSKTF